EGIPCVARNMAVESPTSPPPEMSTCVSRSAFIASFPVADAALLYNFITPRISYIRISFRYAKIAHAAQHGPVPHHAYGQPATARRSRSHDVRERRGRPRRCWGFGGARAARGRGDCPAPDRGRGGYRQ